MKNIHILSTDKPSRLSILNNGKLNFGAEFISSTNTKAKHIYITSDEEIKEGDWYYNSFLNEISKMDVLDYSNFRQKIILTTDQELIKDGVQAIDDEFLEWLVKNPSCESVEVDSWSDDLDGYWLKKYKIFIPKEEPKQETLEEAMNKNGYQESDYDKIWREGVEFGAKWQQEQILDFLYSEITERRDYSASKMCEKVIEFIEQFKNK